MLVIANCDEVIYFSKQDIIFPNSLSSDNGGIIHYACDIKLEQRGGQTQGCFPRQSGIQEEI